MPNRKKDYADMEKYAITRNKQKRRYYQKTASLYEKRPWTLKEEDMVLKHEISDTELSKKIKRSVGAIQKRRYLLNKQN